ncbi:ergothioneine biosynthesis glutamate--cysteine ligase EgtA [Pseudonocardia sp. H11422]|uniref:ergothioneine biosynthesis glutamate--cysteine ligase EgtA n=1 Tax=Pseudonocardia sp. H11422 TaxID=2835866 RepID=UPI0027E358D5|nr:ergothioneine biosynthesis glutamate--cysteine ligase EgtA [Pseudonocardia sp. H11422]
MAQDSGTVRTTGDAVGTSVMDRTATGPVPQVLRSCAEAEAYVASVCFKHGPPRLAGVELEWVLHRVDAPAAPVDLPALIAALGPHIPTALDPSSPALPLPAGSTVTVEPGGQVELASPPMPGLGALVPAAQSDADELHRLLASHGMRPQPRAADPIRPPRRVLELPRYRAMEQSFDRIGPYGRTGMCSTAAVQVCLDAGEGPAIATRWNVLHALGPVLVAAFANSPVLHGRPTGWKSSRMATWLSLDPARTAPPASVNGDPAAAWAARVVQSPLLCVRREGTWSVPERVTFADWVRGALPTAPTTADLDYHVSTLFPPVRPRGHLEVRYIDGQSGREWALPTAVLVALLSDPVVIDRVLEACEPARDRWISAARHGLADRVLARAAATVFPLACAALPAAGAPPELVAALADVIERRVLRGRCPADDPPPLDDPAGGAAPGQPVACTDRAFPFDPTDRPGTPEGERS